MSDIQNLIEALDRNTAALNASAEQRGEVLKAATAVTEAAPRTTKAAAEKPAAEKPAASAKADAPEDKVAAAVNAYMEGVAGAEREARKAEVAKLFGKVGAKKRSEIPADKEAAVIKALATLLERGNVLEEEEPAGEEAEDDLLV